MGNKKVVILHDIQGFEHEEIARILGCAAGTQSHNFTKREENCADCSRPMTLQLKRFTKPYNKIMTTIVL